MHCAIDDYIFFLTRLHAVSLSNHLVYNTIRMVIILDNIIIINNVIARRPLRCMRTVAHLRCPLTRCV